MVNREINEQNLRKADSFRVQAQIKNRRQKIMYGAIYNWIAKEFPDVSERIRDSIVGLAMRRLEQEFLTIIDTNPKTRQSLNAFLDEVILDRGIRREANSIISGIRR